MSLQLITLSDMERMAEAIAASKMFGINTREQALALGLLCQAEGLHPATAARDYHIINGKPSLKSEAMLSRFQQAGGRVKWDKYSDDEVVGTFSHAQGGSVTVSWTLDRAKKAGLANRDVWKSYTRQMLKARVVSEAIRMVFPSVLSGCYTPEEVESFDAPAQIATTEQAAEVVSFDLQSARLVLERCTTEQELRERFAQFYLYVQSNGFGQKLLDELVEIKNSVKSKLV
jgi:hypothetical protein